MFKNKFFLVSFRLVTSKHLNINISSTCFSLCIYAKFKWQLSPSKRYSKFYNLFHPPSSAQSIAHHPHWNVAFVTWDRHNTMRYRISQNIIYKPVKQQTTLRYDCEDRLDERDTEVPAKTPNSNNL